MEDEARKARQTTLSALLWTSALLVGSMSGGALVADAATRRPTPQSAVVVLALTALAAFLGLSLFWDLRPSRSWPLPQLILWVSVAMVWLSLAGSWAVPWYFHWLAGFASS